MGLPDNSINEKLVVKMTEFFSADPKRIQHFIKVSALAKTIAILENVDEYTADVIHIAGIVHDIGIKPAEVKYGKGNCGGKYQQELGPEPARKILKELGYCENIIDRVCFLIAHHHTYANVDGIDWQILIEADFLVNAYEDNMDISAIKSVREKIFATRAGIQLIENMYGLK